MGGSTKTLTSTSNQTTSPYAPAVPALNNILNVGQSLYDSGAGTGIYSGPRVATPTADTLTGYQSIEDQAGADNSAGIGLTALQNIAMNNGGVSYNGPQLDGNGLSSGTVGALGNLANVQGADLGGLNSFIGSTYGSQSPINQTAGNFMSGANDITTSSLYQGLLGYNAGPSASESNLSGVASGQYLDPTTNPYLQAAVAASNQNVGNAQKEAFANSGRYGSGNFAAATAKAINDTDTSLYASQYNQERQNQLSANSMLDAARTNRISAGGTLANDLTNVQSTNNQQKLAGAGLLQSQNAQNLSALGTQLSGNEFNSTLDYNKAATALGTYQQGTANAMTNGMNAANVALNSQGQAINAANSIPALDASRYLPGQTLLGIGSAQQGQDQNYINAAMQEYQQQQSMPWNSLDNYASLVGGIGGMGGTTSGVGTQQVPQAGLGQTLLGGALGIGGLVAKLGGAGLLGGFGSIGSLMGGGDGGVGGIGDLSDWA